MPFLISSGKVLKYDRGTDSNTRRISHRRVFFGNKILLELLFSEMMENSRRVHVYVLRPFYTDTSIDYSTDKVDPEATPPPPHLPPPALVVNGWTTGRPWTTHLQCGKTFQEHHYGSEVRMIKTVDTPSSLEEKRRFHRTNSDDLAMERILRQKSAGFFDRWDAATEFSKWMVNLLQKRSSVNGSVSQLMI